MNIIINGGSKGIGKEIALLLSKDAKNQIIVSGRNEPELISVAENSAFHNITTMLLDLSIIEKDLEVIRLTS